MSVWEVDVTSRVTFPSPRQVEENTSEIFVVVTEGNPEHISDVLKSFLCDPVPRLESLTRFHFSHHQVKRPSFLQEVKGPREDYHSKCFAKLQFLDSQS